MASFLKWAETVLDKVDEQATDRVKDLRGDKAASTSTNNDDKTRRLSSALEEKVRRSSDAPLNTPPLTPVPSSLSVPPSPLSSSSSVSSFVVIGGGDTLEAAETDSTSHLTTNSNNSSAPSTPIVVVENLHSDPPSRPSSRPSSRPPSRSPSPCSEPSLSPVKKPEILLPLLPLLNKKVSLRNNSNTSVAASPERVSELEAENAQLKTKVQEATIEAGGLRTVWQETRDALSRAKKLLIQKDDQYKKVLKEKEAEAQHDIDNVHNFYAEQIKELKRTISQNQLEFGSALSAKEGHREDQAKDFGEMKQQRDEAIARGENLQAEVARLEDIRDELIQSKQELVAQHKRVLLSLREEQEKKDEALEKQKTFHSESLKNFQSRAFSLEQDTQEYVSAVATAQREVEEKSRELSRVLSESRWIKMDQQALRDEITALQQQIEIEKTTRVSIETNWQTKLEQSNARLEQATKANQQMSAQRAREEVVFKQMEMDLATERANPCKQQVVELDSRLTHLTEHFTSQIDSLTSERTTLRLLLEDEKARSALLQAELATTNVRTLEEEDGDETDVALLMEQGTRLKRRGKLEMALFRKEFQSPAVKSAIGLLDGLGAYIGVALRRNPAARLLFALYILLLHLWVVVVLYHTFHSVGHLSLDPPGHINLPGHNS